MENVSLDLDGAWGELSGIRQVDARRWGPSLRYHGTRREVEAFWEEFRTRLGPYVLYGSGDYHYLAAVLFRRVTAPAVTLVSFDNHPDWDVRPPHWACGGWINRALEMPNVTRASVWGCGNFELAWPSRLFANRRALRDGRLKIHAWAERQKSAVCRRFNCMNRADWRQRFQAFAGELADQSVYVTVDLDCLREEEAVTNWENGLFTADDIAWALRELRARAKVVAGDLCGAWSEPTYARGFQRFAANWDHPKLPPIEPREAMKVNHRALETIWPALAGN